MFSLFASILCAKRFVFTDESKDDGLGIGVWFCKGIGRDELPSPVERLNLLVFVDTQYIRDIGDMSGHCPENCSTCVNQLHIPLFDGSLRSVGSQR